MKMALRPREGAPGSFVTVGSLALRTARNSAGQNRAQKSIRGVVQDVQILTRRDRTGLIAATPSRRLTFEMDGASWWTLEKGSRTPAADRRRQRNTRRATRPIGGRLAEMNGS